MELKETSAAGGGTAGGGGDLCPSSPAQPPAWAPAQEFTANLQRAPSRANGRQIVGDNGSGNPQSVKVELIRNTVSTGDSGQANPVIARAMTMGLM